MKNILHLNCLVYKVKITTAFFSPWNIYNSKIYDSNTCLLLNDSTSDKSEDLTIIGRGFKTCKDNFTDSLDKRFNISNFFNVIIADIDLFFY